MRLVVYAVSDASGATAERVVQSALVQFEEAPAIAVRRGNVRTVRALRSVVREAARGHSIIVHPRVE